MAICNSVVASAQRSCTCAFPLRSVVGGLRCFFQLLGSGLDLFLPPCSVRPPSQFFPRLAACQGHREFGEVLLVALRLIVVPLVRMPRSSGSPLRSCRAAPRSASGRPCSRRWRRRWRARRSAPPGGREGVAAVVDDVLDLVIVRSMDMETVTGHGVASSNRVGKSSLRILPRRKRKRPPCGGRRVSGGL